MCVVYILVSTMHYLLRHFVPRCVLELEVGVTECTDKQSRKWMKMFPSQCSSPQRDVWLTVKPSCGSYSLITGGNVLTVRTK